METKQLVPTIGNIIQSTCTYNYWYIPSVMTQLPLSSLSRGKKGQVKAQPTKSYIHDVHLNYSLSDLLLAIAAPSYTDPGH